ncbi:hypothetical protein HPP92_025324 [Vanilla planifolia]|uniref:C3H1-type domain-containing protein n=1 Tax=Vanilla planifolia TaxID=51239 RepID=A0A835PF74_VANPL|nr:hypothetical protein HPP92_025324 [Vanilla planifolia]
MGLIDEQMTEFEERGSFGSTLFTAAAAEAVGHGLNGLRLMERPRRWLPAGRNADGEVAEGHSFRLGLRSRTALTTLGLITEERDNGFLKEDQCKFYYMPGGCRFGETCRYSHSIGKTEGVPVELNVLGLPVRPGGRECPYYMRTGICKYSASCKYHHPEPSNLDGLHVLGYQSGSSFQSTVGFSQPETSQLVTSAPNDCHPGVSKPYVPVMSFSEWLNQFANQNAYRDSNQCNLMKRTSSHPRPVDAPFHLKGKDNAKEITESELQNGIKCDGFKLSHDCMPYHAKFNPSKLETCLLSSIGLPLRPVEPVCIFYDRFGLCKFGPACKFDHPVNHNSAQSVQAASRMIIRPKEEGSMEGRKLYRPRSFCCRRS